MHRIIYLAVRNRPVEKILCEGKITVVGAVSDYTIILLIIDMKHLGYIFLSLMSQRRI